jgi:2-methylfumaryl-CoA isomerase
MWSPYRDFAQAARDGAAGTLLAPLRQLGVGEHLAPGSPLTLAGHRAPPQPAPELGEHADAVLGELLGLTAVETARLRAAGIIGP